MLEPRSACGPRPTRPAAGSAAKLAAQRYNRKPPPHRFLLCRSPFRLAPEFKTAVTAPGVLDCQRTKAEPGRMDDDRDRLAFYPFVVVRIACRQCSQRGSYRLARLAAKYGRDQPARANGAVLARLPLACRSAVYIRQAFQLQL
jgi:hypothetical protein